jgi:hypothetical protein
MLVRSAAPSRANPAGRKAAQMLDQALDLAVTTLRTHGTGAAEAARWRGTMQRRMGADFFLLPVAERAQRLRDARDTAVDEPTHGALQVLLAIAEGSSSAFTR